MAKPKIHSIGSRNEAAVLLRNPNAPSHFQLFGTDIDVGALVLVDAGPRFNEFWCGSVITQVGGFFNRRYYVRVEYYQGRPPVPPPYACPARQVGLGPVEVLGSDLADVDITVTNNPLNAPESDTVNIPVLLVDP